MERSSSVKWLASSVDRVHRIIRTGVEEAVRVLLALVVRVVVHLLLLSVGVVALVTSLVHRVLTDRRVSRHGCGCYGSW